MGVGGFYFLDAIGFRYYLPAAMIRWLLGEGEGFLPYNLRLGRRGRLRDYTLKQWSLLNDEQRAVVARFIRYERERDKEVGNENGDWKRAYESYWHAYDPEGTGVES